MLKKMLANQPCNLTECKQLWDFLYIDDAIDGLVKLIENHCEAGIYNFGSGESKSLKYYVEKMYQVAGSHSQLNYGVVPYPVTGMVNANPSVEKLKGIGWKSQTFFEDGLRQIIGELRDD
jgi:nucleoside-diphosphate-sugar epimerase